MNPNNLINRLILRFIPAGFLHVSGDSFVVNAFLRRGMEECERYSATDHKLKNMQVSGIFLSLFHVYFLCLLSDNKPNNQNQLILIPCLDKKK